MSILERFKDAVAATAVHEDTSPAQLPIRLSKACTRVLPVAGAGLSLFSDPTMPIPIGASDDTALIAEQLQFTTAEGPCFTAHRTGQSVIAADLVIAQRWPIFHDGLITRTPIRGIVSIPLPDALTGFGVLDLYVHHPDDLARINLDHLQPITGYIAAALSAGPLFPQFRDGPPWGGPLWSQVPAAGARGNVMIAMGMLSVTLGLGLADALAALRAHAFTAGRTVDATAFDIIDRTLPTTALAIDANT
ncbi:GAF domain-containing protein [Nakamurella sp. GG22]